MSFVRPDKEFRVFQFQQGQIPRIDGDFLIWNIIPESNTIGIDELKNAKKLIDRQSVVERLSAISDSTLPNSPAQVGNGEFAFGVDITGLQTFVPVNTLSHWSWHSFPLPTGLKAGDFKGLMLDTHGRMVRYNIENDAQPELSSWLAGNPHRYNLGRIGFLLLKSDGTRAGVNDLTSKHQEIDLWNGIIYSSFQLEGKPVKVETACAQTSNVIGVSVESDLVKKRRIKIFFDFPYTEDVAFIGNMGNYKKLQAHSTKIENKNNHSTIISRKIDETKYFVSLNWTTNANLLSGDTISSPRRFYLNPVQSDKIALNCKFSKKESNTVLLSVKQVFQESCKSWPEFWKSGAAIDLSGSKDSSWKELERRSVLSQYLMKVNEAGSFPPQESGFVNNGWYGRFHFEMTWWHQVHYALWNRWELMDKSLHVFPDFLPTSKERATEQGYKGARWPKCTADFDRDCPHPIHALLIWQQPHPIYYAEQDYRLHPSQATLDKWKNVVFETVEFMAEYADYEKSNVRYILGPPMFIVSENTKPEITYNPSFELSYWRYGLPTAQKWNERLGLQHIKKWDEVLKKLSPLPQEDGLYVTHEKIDSMWTKFNSEHPALTGIYWILSGDGMDLVCVKKPLIKCMHTGISTALGAGIFRWLPWLPHELEILKKLSIC